jgi:O-methyltransferase|tara:strand:- start:3431 stop:3988 length:558 start_codon:yes stop_codon:yes gene_type:complete
MAAHALRELPQGDLVETGVFQGGTTVLMARVIHNLSSPRVLYACDSFLGLPRAQSQDREIFKWDFKSPRTHVEHVLHKEGLMHHVRIVSGWFHQSLPPRGLRSISMLRLDGDTFNGTYEALRWLYPLVMDGGIVYLDDVGSFKGAHAAMTGYFGHSMGTRILEDDGHYYEALWWRKGIVQEWLSF